MPARPESINPVHALPFPSELFLISALNGDEFKFHALVTTHPRTEDRGTQCIGEQDGAATRVDVVTPFLLPAVDSRLSSP